VPALAPFAASGGNYSWRRACFNDLLGDNGDACLLPTGNLSAAECLSGRCDPYGARGLCTSSCDDVACPSVDACAAFSAAPTAHLCLRRCDASHPCNDPLLACELAGQPGSLGFTVPGTEPAGATYCAPRRCDGTPSICAPSGSCVPMGGASYCVRN
jgi:hypothetical protein